jgi:hypothetical protein
MGLDGVQVLRDVLLAIHIWWELLKRASGTLKWIDGAWAE